MVLNRTIKHVTATHEDRYLNSYQTPVNSVVRAKMADVSSWTPPSRLLPFPTFPSSSHFSPPPPRHRITSNIYAAATAADCSDTHITVSRFVKVCVCVYYLYIRWVRVSAGITNMFLDISGEIVWNSSVANDGVLTALSGPQRLCDNTPHVRHTLITAQSHRKTKPRQRSRHTERGRAPAGAFVPKPQNAGKASLMM